MKRVWAKLRAVLNTLAEIDERGLNGLDSLLVHASLLISVLCCFQGDVARAIYVLMVPMVSVGWAVLRHGDWGEQAEPADEAPRMGFAPSGTAIVRRVAPSGEGNP